MPVIGETAPPISALDQSGKTVNLSDFLGKTVVLYFYPKDDTPGCTKEACGFRDDYASFTNKGVVILGVSPDDTAKHKKFVDKYNLPFSLLADPEKVICQAYGVWKEKSMYGRTSMGVERTTFVISPEGKIDKIFAKVKVEGHISKVLDSV
ncbi:MAG: thioredoxin-dependent thiol peroxidase [Planctomycetota bacterium]|nr:thioredoxin-dependent thiol peroxidase [Planctomycetota bacterium]